MSRRVLIIGAGGVGRVVTHKCAQVSEVFGTICLASRTKSKCDQIASEVSYDIETSQVDAEHELQLISLMKHFKPDLVIHAALPYQNLHIMNACLQCGISYIDTANYEAKDIAKFEYKQQWSYHEKFAQKGIIALLGSGFDPGVVNVFCAYVNKHLLDHIERIDIFDCNDGEHGHAFATNFNPEINLREVSAKGRFWENGVWKETPPLSQSCEFDYPEIGLRRSYLMYHEEIESLCKYIIGVRRIRFWMTFSEAYLRHLKVLQNVGLTRIDKVKFGDQDIVPLQFLKAILPDPARLASQIRGQTCIGCRIEGKRNGQTKRLFIYNRCRHEKCFEEVKSQAVPYTTGVPAMIGAKMLLEGKWAGKGVFNLEQFDPDPFMNDLQKYGLAWKIKDL